MFWSAKVSRCLAVSTLPATEANAVSENWLCSAASACCDGSSRAVRSTICWVIASSRRRRVDHQIPQLLERLPLGIELAVGLGRRHDHPGQQVATLLQRLRDGVVEDLADVERLRQRRLRVGDRLAERRRLLVAEFLDSQSQFVVAGAHGVVDVHHHRLGQVVERVDLNRGQRIGVGGIHPPRRRELGLPALAAPPPRPQPQQQHQDDEDGQRDEQAEPGDPCVPGRIAVFRPSAAATAAPAQSLPRSAGSISLRRRSSETVSLTIVRRHQERIGAVRGGDGQDGILVVQVAGAPGAFGPVDRALAGEAVDVDHPEPDLPVVVELVDGLLAHRCAANRPARPRSR